jgi:hypothetical protein
MPELLAALEGFLQEHRRGGDLHGVERATAARPSCTGSRSRAPIDRLSGRPGIGQLHWTWWPRVLP